MTWKSTKSNLTTRLDFEILWLEVGDFYSTILLCSPAPLQTFLITNSISAFMPTTMPFFLLSKSVENSFSSIMRARYEYYIDGPIWVNYTFDLGIYPISSPVLRKSYKCFRHYTQLDVSVACHFLRCRSWFDRVLRLPRWESKTIIEKLRHHRPFRWYRAVRASIVPEPGAINNIIVWYCITLAPALPMMITAFRSRKKSLKLKLIYCLLLELRETCQPVLSNCHVTFWTSDLEWTARRRCFVADTFKLPAPT